MGTELNLMLFGSVPKGTKVDRYNEFDIQLRAKMNWISSPNVNEGRQHFIQQLRDAIISAGYEHQPHEVKATKSGAMVTVWFGEESKTDFDIVPCFICPEDHIDCVRVTGRIFEDLVQRGNEIPAWPEVVNKFFRNCWIYYEDPANHDRLGPAYYVEKILGPDNQHYVKYFPQRPFDEELTNQQRELIQTAKIFRDELQVKDAKSFVIETVCRTSRLSGVLGRDLHKILSHPSLKRHFISKVDFARWEFQLRNNQVNQVPLFT